LNRLFRCEWEFASVAATGKHDLGEVDIVSAGAIAQAAMYVLLRLPSVRMKGRVFDR